MHLYRPIVFDEPDRLVDPPSWIEHIPFAFWLIDALRPAVFVELGTQSGNSYAAFAQAVAKLGLPTACYAVDTWKGDAHSGLYDEDVFAEWRDYHDRQFGSFSRLIRSSFAEAATHFTDESIDLLHVDGFHTFDSVQQDFATWLPKVSGRGIVLLHDINVRERDFGAWRLWQQLEHTYPSFAFLHGHGLGVLGVGRDYPEPVQWLFEQRSARPETIAEIRQFFARLGSHLSRRHQERAGYESRFDQMHTQLQSQLADERNRREKEVGDVEVRRKSNRAWLDRAILEIETRDLRAASDVAHREKTIRELDAEAKTLAAFLHASLKREAASRTTIDRLKARLSSQLSAAHASSIGRARAAVRGGVAIGRAAMAAGTWRGRARSLAGFATNPRRFRDADRIARSGLFDADYYQRRYPDVTASGTDPLIHYVLWGAQEGRGPHPLFDPSYYLEHNPDVARSSFLPLVHFLLHGASEQRNPGPYFDSSYYLSANPAVAASGTNPLVDFVRGGWRQGRNPSASFDCVAYAERYEDVRTSGINPLVHYVEIGSLEGRDAASLADVALAVEPRVPMRSSSLREPDPPERLVLCLTHVCPWPTHAGNAYRINRLLLRLQSDGFKVVPVIAPLPGEMPDIDAIRKVAELFSNVVVVDRNGSVRYLLKDVPDVLSSLDGEQTPRFSAILDEEAPVSQRERELLAIERRYCHDAVIAAVLRLHSALPRYVLLTEYAWMSRLLPLVDRRAIKVIDTHDVYSTKAAKVLKYGLRELWLSDEEEARRLKRADLVIAIQNEEHALLDRLVPAIPVVTAGIDFELEGQPALPDGRRILYVGSGNPMNVRGLQEFLRFAWPAIRQEVPDAELMVAGAVSEGVRGLSGVNALGRVDDLTELYRSARVVINPAHAGTGLKIKTLEALSHLRPIVTWPTGVEGLPDALKALCDVVQDWYEFGPRVVSRLRTERIEAFSPAERALIVIHVSPDAVYRDLSREIGRLWREHAPMPARESTA